MKRLTIHLRNVPKVEHKGKMKIFNTVSHTINKDEEANAFISEYIDEKVVKTNISNIL